MIPSNGKQTRNTFPQKSRGFNLFTPKSRCRTTSAETLRTTTPPTLKINNDDKSNDNYQLSPVTIYSEISFGQFDDFTITLPTTDEPHLKKKSSNVEEVVDLKDSNIANNALDIYSQKRERGKSETEAYIIKQKEKEKIVRPFSDPLLHIEFGEAPELTLSVQGTTLHSGVGSYMKWNDQEGSRIEDSQRRKVYSGMEPFNPPPLDGNNLKSQSGREGFAKSTLIPFLLLFIFSVLLTPPLALFLYSKMYHSPVEQLWALGGVFFVFFTEGVILASVGMATVFQKADLNIICGLIGAGYLITCLLLLGRLAILKKKAFPRTQLC